MNWIKMRTGFQDDPRVLSIARQLKKSDKEIIGALYILWSIADRWATDEGVLEQFTVSSLNKKIGLKKFVEVLPSDWVDLSGEWVKLPNYAEHNGSTAKTRAQGRRRVARHRNAKTVTNVTQDALIEKRREEKKREDNRSNNPLTPLQGEPAKPHQPKKETDIFFGIDIPDTMRPQVAEWIGYRKEIRKPITKRMIEKILTTYDKQPRRLQDAVNHSIENGYIGLFEKPVERHVGPLNGTQSLHSKSEKKSNTQHNYDFAQQRINEILEKEKNHG